MRNSAVPKGAARIASRRCVSLGVDGRRTAPVRRADDQIGATGASAGERRNMTIRIGILGAAKIAPPVVINPSHDNPDFEVVAVGARDPERATAYAAEHKIPNVAKDYDALLRRNDVDLVYNALPPGGHARWTIAALEAGKHVLCEKPFAMNAAQVRRMNDAAAKSGRKLVEAFHYRHHVVMKRAVEI